MRRLGGPVAAAAACVVAAWLFFGAEAPSRPPPEAPKMTRGSVSPAATSPSSRAPPRPPSIADVEEDGNLTAGSAGELVIDVELRRFFDFHLLVTGEEPPEVTRARLERRLDERLPPRAAREARELLGRYLAMREAARGLAAAPDEDLAVRLAAVRELRRRHLGEAAAEAMFGPEEAEDDAALARRRDPQLTAGSAPDPATVPLATLRAEARRAPDEVRALRTAAFGADGAVRLGELDAARAAWERRLAAFREARAGLSLEAARELLARSFSEPEQLRVRALERAAGRPLD